MTPRRPRVAVVEFSGKGGLMHYTFQLCRAMAARGAEVVLVTDRHFELRDLERSFEVVELLRLWDPKPENEGTGALLRQARRAVRAVVWYREWLRLLRWLRRERPDIVQFGDVRFPADLACFALLRLLGLRAADVCHNVHPFRRGGGTAEGSRASRLVLGRLYRLFDRVFVHFDSNRRLFVDSFPVDPARVRAIPHGGQEIFRELRDPEFTPMRLRRELDLAAEDRVVLFLGTLSPNKGVDLLVDALPRLLEDEPRAVLVAAGFPVGVDPDDLIQRARRLGVEARLRLVLRYLPSRNVAGWVEAAEVMVFPYREIFQSGALHLALTFRRPVVATAVGTFPDVIRHGSTGLLVPPGDAAALSGAVAALLADPHRAREMAQRAGRESDDRYSWDEAARAVLEEYGLLLGGGAA